MKISEATDDQDEAGEQPRHQRPEQQESDDAAWGDYRPAEQQPEEDKPAGVRSIADIAGLSKVLELHPIDERSREVAADCGHRMAAEYVESNWQQASPDERERIATRLARTTEESLELAPRRFDIQEQPFGVVGGSDTEHVEMSDSLLESADMRPVVETIAHEYRHVWQSEIIDGQREHPLGDAGRLRLTRGLLRYADDRQDLLGYATNGMELDAEAFARRVAAAYEEEKEKLEDERHR